MSVVNAAVPYADAWHYPVVLRRHWLVVVLGALLGLLAALGYYVLGTPSFTATAAVDVNAISSQPFNATRPSSGLLDAQTEQELAQSSTVATQVSDALGGSPKPPQVRSHLRATLPTGGTVMQISYTAASADDARLGAATAADSYLSYRSQLAQDRQTAVIENLRTQEKSLRAQLAKANADIFSTKAKSTARTQAISDRQSVTIALSTLSSQLNSVASIDTSGGAVLSSPHTTPVTTSPSTVTLLLTGLLVGLVLGLVAAFALDRWGRRVRDDRDVARAGAGSVLARLTERSASIPAAGSDVDRLSVLRERTLAMLDGSGDVVAVLDRTHGPNPTDVPVNLALSMLDGGHPVSLVLVGYESLLEDLVGRLDLVRIPHAGSGDDAVFESRAHPDLRIRHLRDTSPELAMSQERTADRAQRGHVRIIAAGNKSPQGPQLNAARAADVVLLVVGNHLSRTELTHVSAELAAVGASARGVVLVSGRRTLQQARAGSPRATVGAR